MNEWKDKLKSIQGLIELVKTSALSRGEITAIVDFIQVLIAESPCASLTAYNQMT